MKESILNDRFSTIHLMLFNELLISNLFSHLYDITQSAAVSPGVAANGPVVIFTSHTLSRLVKVCVGEGVLIFSLYELQQRLTCWGHTI